jgi:hypothetical protein
MYAREHNLEERLEDGYALQLEFCGPGVQGNPMGLKKVDAYCFNVFDIAKQTYDPNGRVYAEMLGVKCVPIVLSGMGWGADRWQQLADGERYSNDAPAEGIVVRPRAEMTIMIEDKPKRVSFKVINSLYKD